MAPWTKIVILSGSGLSAESGLPTFRDSAGLWNRYSWVELASPEGWARQPEVVLAFYNERRAKAWKAEPNAAHRAIAALETKFEVIVITQNVDALHERAGSTRVCTCTASSVTRAARAGRAGVTGSTTRRSSSDRSATRARSCGPTSCGSAKRRSTWTRRATRGRGGQGAGRRHVAHGLSGRRARRCGAAATRTSVGLTGDGWNTTRVRFPRGKATELVPPLVEQWLSA